MISAPEGVIQHSFAKMLISIHFSRHHKAWRTGSSVTRQAFAILAIPSIGDLQQAVVTPQVALGLLCDFTLIYIAYGQSVRWGEDNLKGIFLDTLFTYVRDK